MNLGIAGRTALVAASSRGLGRAIAEELAAAGANLALCSRDPARLETTRAEIASGSGVRVIAEAVDLTEPAGVEAIVRRAVDELGPVDILVTNTGGPPPGPFESHSPETWRGAIAQNLESVLNLTRAVLPQMKTRRWGRIVNVTSIAVKQPVDGLILSNAVRAAVTGFARTLANEVAGYGITVNNVLPGYTRTERLDELARSIAGRDGIPEADAYARWTQQIPAGRLGEPRELAALATFLASERAAYITGTSIPVDGGWTRSLL